QSVVGVYTCRITQRPIDLTIALLSDGIASRIDTVHPTGSVSERVGRAQIRPEGRNGTIPGHHVLDLASLRLNEHELLHVDVVRLLQLLQLLLQLQVAQY